MTVPKRNYTRIDTLELKDMIVRKVGHQRADKYFDQLRRLLSSKISKSEFNRVCIMVIGRENIHLHNQLIRAILKNAYLAKVPPPRGSTITRGATSVKASNRNQSSSVQTPYEEASPPSPQRAGSAPNGDHRFKGRQNPLGLLDKTKNLASEELAFKAQVQQSPTELNSLGSRPPVSVEEGEEVEQMTGSPSIQHRSPVTAPLGISMNSGCNRKLVSNVSSCSKYYPETCYDKEDLPDTRSLRSRLEQKLEKEGLTVSLDYVNLLNNALDSYLKRLIESSLALAGSRNERIRLPNGQGVPGSNVLLPGRYMHTVVKSAEASVLDFCLAMQLNPQLLGPDWPEQLEKICIRASEE